MAYADLLIDRGLLLSLMHAFILGSDPVIGKAARDGFLEVYKFLRFEAGSRRRADIFLAHGMMMNTMVGLRMADEYANGDPCAHRSARDRACRPSWTLLALDSVADARARPALRARRVTTGILLVDKPGGIPATTWSSRARRALGTRKVGHAGTLDPMATGC